jgi:hypothetical protein
MPVERPHSNKIERSPDRFLTRAKLVLQLLSDNGRIGIFQGILGKLSRSITALPWIFGVIPKGFPINKKSRHLVSVGGFDCSVPVLSIIMQRFSQHYTGFYMLYRDEIWFLWLGGSQIMR